jgi:flagellar basal body-associated protein FliL
MNQIMLIAALSLSAIAAFYSIAGLTAIFAAAVVPIIIMGSILEISKLVVASWLYRNWKEVPTLLKSYFTIAVVILMIITSMGIFGFLSKAHLDQAVPAGDISAQVTIFDDKIKTEKDNIEAARKALSQMDAQLDQKLSRSTDEKGADKAIQIRRSQSSERKKLQNEIAEAQKTIIKLQTERAPIASQARKVEAEVGPVKYIAALIYGDTLDQNMLEKAVRWVIIMIVLVFDPLAVLMLVAFNWSLKKSQPTYPPKPTVEKENDPEVVKGYTDMLAGRTPEGWHEEWVPDTETWPKYELDDGPLTDEQYEKIQEEANKSWSVGPPPVWPEDDKRSDIIGQNGNDGIHYDEVPTAPPPPPPKEPSLGANINEYDSPSKTIEQEVDDLNQKPLNSLDRLKRKYGNPDS